MKSVGEVIGDWPYFSKQSFAKSLAWFWKWALMPFNPQLDFSEKNKQKKAFLRASVLRVQNRIWYIGERHSVPV